MKLLTAEFQKLFSKRVFVSCMIMFLLVNVLAFTYTQSDDYITKTIHDNKELYRDLISKCDGKSTEEALDYLSCYASATTILYINNQIQDESDPDELEMRKQSLEWEKEKHPSAYELSLTLDITDEEMVIYPILIDDLKSQCKSHTSFTQGIDEMDQRAAQQTYFSIFSEEGAFAKANTEKTLADFQCMKGRHVTIGNNTAVTAATTFALTDYFVFAIVFAACIFLFTTERDKNLYCLIRSTKRGRLPLISAKLSALAIVTVFISAVYYFSTIAAAAYYTGLGDTSRTIQSVPLFHNCNLELTILEYLILWVLSKTAAMFAIAMLLAMIFTLIKSTPTVTLVCALLFGSEFIMYTVIDRNSWINYLKYINIFCLVNGNNVFGDYLNLNIFTIPVNMMTVYAVIVPLMFLVSAAFTCLMFVKRSQFAKAAVWDNLLDKLRAKLGGNRGSVLPFSCESYKHYKGSLVWLVILMLAYNAYTSLDADLTFYYTDPSDMLYSDYMKTLEGGLTPEKERLISDEQQKIADSYAKIAEISADESIDEYEKASMIDGFTRSVENREKGLAKVTQQYDYIRTVGQERGLTPAFVDVLVYKRLLQNPVKEWRFLALLILVVIFCSSNIFAYEYKRDMVNLIRSTKRGKLHLVLTKLSVILLTTMISYTLIYLPYMINFVKTFGSISLNTPIIMIPDFAGVNSSITITQYICLAGAVHIMAAFLAAVFVSMMSLILKNNTTVMIVSAVVLLVPFVTFYSNEEIRLYMAFTAGKQTIVISAIVASCVTLAMICFFIILKVFFPLRRSVHA